MMSHKKDASEIWIKKTQLQGWALKGWQVSQR